MGAFNFQGQPVQSTADECEQAQTKLYSGFYLCVQGSKMFKMAATIRSNVPSSRRVSARTTITAAAAAATTALLESVPGMIAIQVLTTEANSAHLATTGAEVEIQAIKRRRHVPRSQDDKFSNSKNSSNRKNICR